MALLFRTVTRDPDRLEFIGAAIVRMLRAEPLTYRVVAVVPVILVAFEGKFEVSEVDVIMDTEGWR